MSHICTHTCTQTRTCTHTHAHTCTHMHTHTNTHTCTHTHKHTHTQTHTLFSFAPSLGRIYYGNLLLHQIIEHSRLGKSKHLESSGSGATNQRSSARYISDSCLLVFAVCANTCGHAALTSTKY